MVRAAEHRRQHPLTAERVEVARGRVVEGHAARKRAGDDQVAEDVLRPAAEEVLRRNEEEVGGVLLRDGRGLVHRVVAGEHRPARERVEDPEPDHRDVHRERHDPLRVLRLLGVVRRHLEADPRPEGEEDADAGAARGEAAALEALEGLDRVDRGGGHVMAALAEDAGVEHDQDDDLGDERDAEYARREADVEVGQHRDQADHPEREPEPADLDAVLRELQVEEVGEAAAERRLEHRVRDDGGEGGAHAELAAEAVADERVEAARGRDLARHRAVPDREDREHDRREQEAGRRADAVPVADRDRHVEQHRRDGRRSRHREEEHAHQPDGVLVQEVDVLPHRDVVHRRPVGPRPLLCAGRDAGLPSRHRLVAHAALLS